MKRTMAKDSELVLDILFWVIIVGLTLMGSMILAHHMAS